MSAGEHSSNRSYQSLRFTYLQSCLEFCKHPGCHNTHTHPHAGAFCTLISTQQREREDPNYQAWGGRGGMEAQRINKFILTGVLGQRNEILYVDCEGGRGERKKKELPRRHMSKPITAERRLLFPHPKSLPPPPLFILGR